MKRGRLETVQVDGVNAAWDRFGVNVDPRDWFGRGLARVAHGPD